MRADVYSLAVTVGLLLTVAAGYISRSTERLEDGEVSEREIVEAIQTSLKEYESLRRSRKPESVCYEHVGCFFSEDTVAPGTLPASPEVIGTRFLLYTENHPRYPEIITYTDPNSIRNTSYNSSLPTVFIIHGFASSSDKGWLINMKDAVLDVEAMNVVVIDWRKGAALPYYVTASVNTETVARQIAHFLKILANHNDLKIDTVHVIGFSLGAHVAGFIGETLKKDFLKIGRISGLDPAGPLFCDGGANPRLRLDPSDAGYVDVIHTNADFLLMGGAGCYKDLGHVDFYPNGGKKQPGCSNFFLGAITDLWTGESDKLCNHERSCELYIESMSSSCQFLAFPCPGLDDFDEDFLTGDCFHSTDTRGVLGYHSEPAAGRGALYLVTGSKSPLCSSQVQTRLQVSDKPLVTYGLLQLSFQHDDELVTLQLTQKNDSKIHANDRLSRVVAVENLNLDLSLSPVLAATLTYTAYDGWVWNGKEDFYFDNVILTDQHGNSLYYCGTHTHIHSEDFTPGNETILLQSTPCVHYIA